MPTPDEEAASEAQIERAKARTAEWLQEKATPPGSVCPVCGATRWVIADLVHLPVGKDHAASRLYLLVPVVCSNCGYTRLFHAGLMGAVEPDPPKPAPSATATSSSDEGSNP